jgi:DNA-binding transcriptional MerR regulator
MAQLEIPNRSLFRQPEVCEIASIQPYVLRTWEAEFPDLGVVKAEGGARVYRRADVERVLRIKQLLYGEGLTLAGVRRKLVEERPPEASAATEDVSIAELFGKDARDRILNVKKGLRELSAMLARPAGESSAAGDSEFQLQVDEAPKPRAAAAKNTKAPAKKRK